MAGLAQGHGLRGRGRGWSRRRRRGGQQQHRADHLRGVGPHLDQAQGSAAAHLRALGLVTGQRQQGGHGHRGHDGGQVKLQGPAGSIGQGRVRRGGRGRSAIDQRGHQPGERRVPGRIGSGQFQGQLRLRGLAGTGQAQGPQTQPEAAVAPLGQGVAHGAGPLQVSGPQGQLRRGLGQAGMGGHAGGPGQDAPGGLEIPQTDQGQHPLPRQVGVLVRPVGAPGPGGQQLARQLGQAGFQRPGTQGGQGTAGQVGGGAFPQVVAQPGPAPGGGEIVEAVEGRGLDHGTGGGRGRRRPGRGRLHRLGPARPGRREGPEDQHRGEPRRVSAKGDPEDELEHGRHLAPLTLACVRDRAASPCRCKDPKAAKFGRGGGLQRSGALVAVSSDRVRLASHDRR